MSTQAATTSGNSGPLGRPRGVAFVILLTAVSAFVIPSEVGRMYAKSGKAQPVSGWTGLWLFPFGIFLIPAIVWYVKVQGGLNRYWESAGALATAPANEPGVVP
jgi:drug/metabolite transporter superfamily protein YnfA